LNTSLENLFIKIVHCHCSLVINNSRHVYFEAKWLFELFYFQISFIVSDWLRNIFDCIRNFWTSKSIKAQNILFFLFFENFKKVKKYKKVIKRRVTLPKSTFVFVFHVTMGYVKGIIYPPFFLPCSWMTLYHTWQTAI
jgi:hypothetical protein